MSSVALHILSTVIDKAKKPYLLIFEFRENNR